MRIAERFTRSRVSRLVWGGLTIVAVLGLAFTYRAEQRALDDELAAAQERGTGYASSVIYGSVESPSLSSTDVNFRHRTLYVAVQAGIFTDPTVARVRLWDVDGVLLFSTDQPRAGVGVLQVQDPAVIQAATEGRVTSSLTTAPFTFATTGIEGDPTRLLQTFSPLRVPDRIDPLGAVQIDFLYEPLVERARLAWLPYQVVFAALAAVFAFLTVLSFRRPVATGVGSTERVVVTSEIDDVSAAEDDGAPAVAAAAAGDGREVAALRDELEVAREQLAQAEEAYHYLETRWKESQGALKRFEGQESPDVEARVTELQDALRRSEAEITLLAARVDSGGDEAMARLVEADQARSQAEARAAAAEARIAELERASTGRSEQSAPLPSAEPEPSAPPGPAFQPVAVAPSGGLFEQLEERLEAAEQRARREEDPAVELSGEASALRARLARTAARKKLGPSSDD